MNNVEDRVEERHAAYFEEAGAANRRVDYELAAIRDHAAYGLFTPVEAAQATVAILEAHLAEVRKLGVRHLGSGQ